VKSPVRLDYLVLRCRDIEQSKRFYEALGLRFKPEQHETGPAHYASTLAEGVVLELYPTTKEVASQRFGLSLNGVANRYWRANRRGGELLRPWDGYTCTLRDPSGHVVDLCEENE